MNKAMVLLAGALATLSLVGPTFAQSTAPAAKEPSAPAEKPGAQRDQTTQQMTASVVSVNPDAKTLTVKRGYKGKQLTFAVSARDVWSAVRSIRWSFGDGSAAQGRVTGHAYARPGRYAAVVTATDSAGHSRSIRRWVSISSG